MNELKKYIYKLVIANAILCAIAINTHAQEPQKPQKPMTVTMDHAKVIQLTKDAKSIVIGNPLVVDVSIQDSKTLILTGKSFGVTNLIALDSEGKEILNENIVVQTHEENLVRIYRRAQRQTLACSPVCENTISIGDEENGFQNVLSQIERRNTISTPVNN